MAILMIKHLSFDGYVHNLEKVSEVSCYSKSNLTISEYVVNTVNMFSSVLPHVVGKEGGTIN